MELRTHSNRAFTLVELIVSMVIFLVVLLAAFSVMISHVQYLQIFQQESMLKEDNSYIIDRLRKLVMNSEHVDITTSPLRLKTYNRNGVNTGTVELNNTTLTYKIEPSGPTDTLSTNVGSLLFSDAQDPGNKETVRVLKVALSTKDPNRAAVSISSVITSIACRLSPNMATVYNINQKKRYFKIQTALDEAASGDEIRCMGKNVDLMFDGAFLENITSSGSLRKSVTLKGAYDETFTIQDRVNTPSIIDGGGVGVVIDLKLSGSGNRCVIDSFTIRNGTGSGLYGGGMRINCDSGTIFTITNNTITQNTTSFNPAGRGGGIYADCRGSLQISYNTITGNTSACGGGIYAECYSRLIVSNNRLERNVSSAHGGGIYAAAKGSSVLTIANNIIADNNINGNYDCGGGIWTESYETATSVISNNTITGNVVSASGHGFGGGIWAYSWQYSSFIIANNVITNNREIVPGDNRGAGIMAQTRDDSTGTITNNMIAENSNVPPSIQGGGGMYASAVSNSALIVNSNTITKNISSQDGGGIWNHSNNTASVKIFSNEISNNTASRGGGGIRAENTSFRINPLTISNNIISGNSAPTGAGISARSHPTFPLIISNNTISGNITGSCGVFGDCFGGGALAIINSIIYNNSFNEITMRAGGSYQISVTYSDIKGGYVGPGTTTNNIDADPLFVGGNPYNYTLRGISPCKNTGDPGILDPDSSRSDMGAYGGPGAGTIGFVMPAADDLSTPDIKENVIGTY